MRLLDKLEELFRNQPKRKMDVHPSLFDRLRNVFFDAEALKRDLQRISPVCRCEDAIAHLEDRCSCTKPPANPAEAIRRKGCLAQLETLRLDVKSLDESLQRHRSDLRPEELTEDLQRELTLIGDFAERLDGIVEELRNHATDFGMSCSNDALQRLKERGAEIDKYSTEFFWSLMKQDHVQRTRDSSQTSERLRSERNA